MTAVPPTRVELLDAPPPVNTVTALAAVEAEVCAQIVKWGQQDHPSVQVGYSTLISSYARTTWPEHRAATDYRAECERRFADGVGSWADIAVEEFAEALDEARYGTPAALYTELIQCAAVFTSWAASVKRNEIDP